MIVGGGVAGLTLASRLSQLLPGQSVTVIEAGGDPSGNEQVMTFDGFQYLQASEHAWSIPWALNACLDDRWKAVGVGKALS